MESSLVMKLLLASCIVGDFESISFLSYILELSVVLHVLSSVLINGNISFGGSLIISEFSVSVGVFFFLLSRIFFGAELDMETFGMNGRHCVYDTPMNFFVILRKKLLHTSLSTI